MGADNTQARKFTPGTDEDYMADYQPNLTSAQQTAQPSPQSPLMPLGVQARKFTPGTDEDYMGGDAKPVAENVKRTSEVQQRIDAGEEPFLALLQRSVPKPERDDDKEKRLRKAGKLAAITNALATIAGAVPGFTKSGKGYVPNVQRTGEQSYIDQLNQLEADYDVANKKYQELEMQARMADLNNRLAREEQERTARAQAAQTAAENAWKAQEKEDDYIRQMGLVSFKSEVDNMSRAVGEGAWAGSVDDWMALTPKQKQEINNKVTTAQHKRTLAEKTASSSAKSGKSSTTMDIDFGANGTFTVDKKVFDANYKQAYAAMVKANPDLAAPKVNTGRQDNEGEWVMREPTEREKQEYLIRNIAESPEAQRILIDALNNQGKSGLSSSTQPSAPQSPSTKKSLGFNLGKTE